MSEIDTSAEAVARMLDGVTPGPWLKEGVAVRRLPSDESYVFVCVTSGTRSRREAEANASFIAWAHDAVPALAAERDTAIMQRNEARAQVARWQRQSAESWAAFSAMRNHINEHLPMRSAEADLINGPEFSVSCENVASDVIAALAAERDRLAAWVAKNGADVDAAVAERTEELTAERDRLAEENARLRDALIWYAEQSSLARLIHSEGDAGRHAIAADGGGRAIAALGKS